MCWFAYKFHKYDICCKSSRWNVSHKQLQEERAHVSRQRLARVSIKTVSEHAVRWYVVLSNSGIRGFAGKSFLARGMKMLVHPGADKCMQMGRAPRQHATEGWGLVCVERRAVDPRALPSAVGKFRSPCDVLRRVDGHPATPNSA